LAGKLGKNCRTKESVEARTHSIVVDLVEGFLRMMAPPNDITGPMNLGNPVETPVIELARLSVTLTGSRSKIVHRPLPVDDPPQRFQTSRRRGRFSIGNRACRA
jgi:nucleoside-diphosphate-sugar epimerase